MSDNILATVIYSLYLIVCVLWVSRLVFLLARTVINHFLEESGKTYKIWRKK